MRKILLMSGLSKGGGAERVLSILANYFSENGYNVTFSSFYDNGYYDLDNNVIKKVFNASSKLSLMSDIRSFIRQQNFDVIICFMYPVSYTLCLSTIGMKKKPIIISSERADPSKPTHHKVEKYLRNWSYNYSDHIVFQTEQARNFFKNIKDSKTSIIKNPISTKLPKANTSERKKNIIAIGRLTVQKNFGLLIRVFKKISEEFEDYKLDIYGEGPLQTELLDIISQLSLGDKVTIHGFSDSIYEILNSSGIYVSCSNYEGISNTMLEALSLGVPTICTDCPVGGAKENIIDGVNGILIETNNEIQLYNSIRELILNKELSKKISENYRIVRNKLDVNNIGDEWIELINKLIDNQRSSK